MRNESKPHGHWKPQVRVALWGIQLKLLSHPDSGSGDIVRDEEHVAWVEYFSFLCLCRPHYLTRSSLAQKAEFIRAGYVDPVFHVWKFQLLGNAQPKELCTGDSAYKTLR